MGLQHLNAIHRVPGVVVVGVADPAADPEAVRGISGPDIRIFSDAASMLEDVSPDVVHIVTPPNTHAAVAHLALRAGCHVYVEKPFATTLADAQAVLAEAAARGLKVCAGHQCLFEAPALRAISRIPEIGRVVQVASHFSFRMVRRTLTPVEQCKDILPHAIYPLLQQMRYGTAATADPIEIVGCDARASGDLFGLLKVGDATGIVEVTLSGRPIEQYQEIIGTNGALRADYVTGALVHLVGPGTGLGTVLLPHRRAFQTLGAANRLLFKVLFGHVSSYAGLHELVRRFYDAIRQNADSPVSPTEILETVDVCQRLGNFLDAAETRAETEAMASLQREAATLPPATSEGVTLVTGATGFLGRKVAAELRHAGFRVRAVTRRVPPPSRQIAGIEYAVADLAIGLDALLLDGVESIVHCAAETAGGMTEHARNSVAATSKLVEAAALAGVRRIIHVSSLAVLEPSYRKGRPVDEQSPLGPDALARGPYVWGKAESERQIEQLAAAAGIELRIVRPGPLVDYANFQPPGRLGRELGPIFLAIGGRQSPLHVCHVGTAARVIRSYVQDFESAPRMLNLIEGTPPTRTELMARYLAGRADLKVWWIPALLLRLFNGPAKLAQRLLLGSQQPVDLYAAFATVHYRTELATQVAAKAGPSSIPGAG